MKYMLLIYQGTTPLPPSPEWDALPSEKKREIYAAYGEMDYNNTVTAFLGGADLDWSLWQVAGDLRLPINGPFVVIAAHIPSAGDEPLPEIESKLRSLDISSAWRRLPDMQVGITHVGSGQKLDRL